MRAISIHAVRKPHPHPAAWLKGPMLGWPVRCMARQPAAASKFGFDGPRLRFISVYLFAARATYSSSLQASSYQCSRWPIIQLVPT